MPNTNPNGLVQSPVFTPEGGIFDSLQEVEISCSTAEAVIYYTADGSEPTKESIRYTGAITVDEAGSPHTLKARAFLTSMTPSTIVNQTYKIDDTDPIIGTGVYGWATDAGWKVCWPATETDVINIVFSISTNDQVVAKNCDPAEQTGYIAASSFTTPPASSADITDIRIVYYDIANNSSARIISKNTTAVEISDDTDGYYYYLEPQSVNLSADGDPDIYYTVNGGNPDMDSTQYTGSSIYLNGNSVINTIRAACFKPDEMTFVYSNKTIRIDSFWDDSFLFEQAQNSITTSWSKPFAASLGDNFTNISLNLEKVSDSSSASQVFLPSGPTGFTFDNSSTIFSAGEAYNINVSATDANSPPNTINADTYWDIYLRDGIILGSTAATDYPLTTSASGSPWEYIKPAAETQLFTSPEIPAGNIIKMRRNGNGSILYCIVSEDNPATADQIWSYDFTAAPPIAPVQLSNSSGDVIDFTTTDTGELVYLAADAPIPTGYRIVSLTPGTSSTEVEEYTFSAPIPAGIELFDASTLVLLFETGTLSPHIYPAAAPSTPLTEAPLAGVAGVTDIMKPAYGNLLYSMPSVDGLSTDICELIDLTPTSGSPMKLDDINLNFHDISAGGKNILFSAVDYSRYNGERLFIYCTATDDLVEIIDLEGTSYTGLTSAAW